jgi:hypothetical protein
MQSPTPYDLNPGGTWTNGSNEVTLSSAITKNIDLADTADWTVSTNVTQSKQTAIYKYGTGSLRFAASSSFTTGKLAYKAFGSAQDFSAYTGISFWFIQSSGTLFQAGELQLRLCSDTTGDTAVETFNIPVVSGTATSYLIPITLDKGSSLAASVQSVSLWLTTDRGAQGFQFNNIFACNTSGPNSICLQTLIAPSTGSPSPWYCMDSINGTSIRLGSHNTVPATTSAFQYQGSTITNGSMRARKCTIIDSSSTWGQVQENGAEGSLTTYSGGWDSTNMTNQGSGQTYLYDIRGWMAGLIPKDYIAAERLNFVRFTLGISPASSCTGSSFTGETITACESGIAINGASTTYNYKYVTNNGETASASTPFNANTGDSARFGGVGVCISSGTITGANITVDNLWSNIPAGYLVANDTTAAVVNSTMTFGSVKGNYIGVALSGRFETSTVNITDMTNSLYGLCCSDFWRSDVGDVFGVCTNNTFNISGSVTGHNAGNYGSGIVCDGYNNVFDLTGSTFDGNDYDILVARNATAFFKGGTLDTTPTNQNVYTLGTGDLRFVGTTFSSTYPMFIPPDNRSTIYIHDKGGTAGAHEIHTRVMKCATDTTTRHTASGYSWRFDYGGSGNAPSSSHPQEILVGRVAVAASSQVTASIWVYQFSVERAIKFVCKKDLMGVVGSEVSTNMTSAVSEWVKLELNVTPTKAGVIEFYVQNTSQSSSFGWFIDDFSVTQA